MIVAGPKVLSVAKATGVAGGIAYTARVQYPGGEPWVTDVTFSGSAYGAPGPVVVIVDGMQEFVSDPGRFGETLDAAWVRRFFGA